MSSRAHPHSPLPAPALHATNPSKSHVLAGVQDAYWSDDEAEDAECPLCLEEMDISDLNFKPCPCGYQICRFCWHHIKENLNGRCPACRRVYTDEAVQFKPINKEDHKRLTQQKKQRERERKELDALNRRHLANVRVVQRNVVYVVGMGSRFAKEELIPTLRSNEYFGQYGRISKIIIVKRTPPGGRAPVVGLYITYHRQQDAARAIAAVDGATSPGGGNEIMRASYGTTKYCMAFLRGVSCPDHGCMNLHEWGDESDCFTKEDLTTLKHHMKDTENRTRTATVIKKGDESDAGLPPAASWATAKGNASTSSTALHNHTNMNSNLQASPRLSRRGGTGARQQRSGSSISAATEIRNSGRDRKSGSVAGKASSQASNSRPATPAGSGQPNRPATPSTAKSNKAKDLITAAAQSARPSTPSVALESDDTGSVNQEIPPTESPVRPAAVKAKVPSAPPGIPAVPPGLGAPPGLPPPSRTTSAVSSPLQNSTQPSQPSYQMSTQAQALMEDIRARREMPPPSVDRSPFPEIDRMLQMLSEGDGEYGGFSFNLDPKLATDDVDETLPLPDLDAAASAPFPGTFFDAFPALRQNAVSNPLVMPPGLSYPGRPIYDPLNSRPPVLERQPTGSSGYTGSFNPFAAETGDDQLSRRYSPHDEERPMSRFTFARGRHGSTSSSLHPASPLGHGDSVSHMSYYNSSELASPANRTVPQWFHSRPEFAHAQSSSAMSSPLAQHAQPAYVPQQQQSGRFQPFESGVSEAQLRDLITSSRRNGQSDQSPYKTSPNQPFNDPAIMSARLASPITAQNTHDSAFANSPSTDNIPSQRIPFGPPPGLSLANGMQGGGSEGSIYGQVANVDISRGSGSAQVSTSPSLEPSVVPSPALSSSDFPALSAVEPPGRRQQQLDLSASGTAQSRAERRAAKKAASAERAAEKQRIAQEKAVVRAAEKERIAQEKAAEKEKAIILKAEKEKAAKEKAEREKAERERVAKEKAEKERQEKEKAEKEKAAREQAARERAEKEQAKRAAAASAKASKAANAAVSARQAETEPTTTSSSPQLEQTPRRPQASKQASAPIAVAQPAAQEPILSKMPKKNRPIAKPIRIPKDEANNESASTLPSAATSEAPGFLEGRTVESSTNTSRAQSVDCAPVTQQASLEQLLYELDGEFPWMNLPRHPFFDLQKINPAAKMPLKYGPLVHALSALSVGGGSFANNMPSGSIDNAVSSFQQLLETLTQTISDLLRLLPRKTWDDNSSFDGVLRDMLKGDDFLDDAGDEQSTQGKEDEVAALTLALERRARWMEVQLSKLEELHRDINTAAVRAVLSFNDNGWDVHGMLPRVGNTLARFDCIGTVKMGDGSYRPVTANELEKKVVEEKEAAVFWETELRESMQRLQALRPREDDY